MPTNQEQYLETANIIQERNRYYTGKFMTAEDFADEQAYFLHRHWLHNRLLHGWGILVGLRVIEHPEELCRQDHVVVTAGIAIDCYGREIILDQDTAFKLPKGKNAGILCLAYEEQKLACGPVLFSDPCEEPTRSEANRVRETAVLSLKHPAEIGSACWPTEDEDTVHEVRNDCDDAVPLTGSTSLKPHCHCLGGVVPLAKLAIGEDPTGRLPQKVIIDVKGRHHLQAPGQALTHIVAVNWQHGQGMTTRAMLKRGGRLTMKFDRQLLVTKDNGVGVNEYTFVVQYWGPQRSPEFLPGTVSIEEDNSLAVFTIEDAFLKNLDAILLNKVLITLKCDFILDCHGECIDGNHCYGQLPSGNGTSGGVFESWFKIEPEKVRSGDHD